MIARSPIRKKRRGPPRRGRVHDEAYLDWIREQKCVCCVANILANWETWSPVAFPYQYHTEAAHVGERGLGQKCSDRETVPLCTMHHRTGQESHHQMGKRFFPYHGLDRDQTIKELNARFELEAKAA